MPAAGGISLLCGSLGDQSLELADGDGDGGSQIGIRRGVLLVDGNASHVSGGLAGDIGGKVGSLFVPFVGSAAQAFMP